MFENLKINLYKKNLAIESRTYNTFLLKVTSICNGKTFLSHTLNNYEISKLSEEYTWELI